MKFFSLIFYDMKRLSGQGIRNVRLAAELAKEKGVSDENQQKDVS